MTLTLYTSHYAASKLILGNRLAPVRISVGSPRYKLPYDLAGSCRLLMPTRPMLKMSYDEYKDRYLAILEGHGVGKIREELEAIETEWRCDLVLLCFESLKKPGEWCHRRMFADWWTEKTGDRVIELDGVFRSPQGLFDF